VSNQKLEIMTIITKDGRAAELFEDYIEGLAVLSMKLNGKEDYFSRDQLELFNESDQTSIKEWLDTIFRYNNSSQ